MPDVNKVSVSIEGKTEDTKISVTGTSVALRSRDHFSGYILDNLDNLINKLLDLQRQRNEVIRKLSA